MKYTVLKGEEIKQGRNRILLEEGTEKEVLKEKGKKNMEFRNIICYFGERNCKPLQYPCLENPMDRGAW